MRAARCAAPATPSIVRSQRSADEELEDALSIALAGGRACADLQGAGCTPPIELASAEVLVVLASGGGRIVVSSDAGPVVQLELSCEARRYELALPAGGYRVALDGAATLRAWPDGAGVLLDDASLARSTNRLSAGALAALAERAAARCTTVGKPAAHAIFPLVAVAPGDTLSAIVQLVDLEPFRSAYAIRRVRDPDRVERSAIVRVVDRAGRAVAHVEVDAVAGMPAEIAMAGLADGEYRLVLSGFARRARRPVPVEGFVVVCDASEVA